MFYIEAQESNGGKPWHKPGCECRKAVHSSLTSFQSIKFSKLFPLKLAQVDSRYTEKASTM